MKLKDAFQTIRQKAFPKRYALESELSGLREEHVRVVSELDGVREELSATREQDARQLADLQQHLSTIQTERKTAQDQVHELQASLAEANLRQQGADQQIRALETKLDETRSQHEATIGLTQETLLRLQSEQHNLLTLQTDLARTFHEVGKQLLESVQATVTRPRPSFLTSIAMAGLLFLTGALVSDLFRRSDLPPIDLSPVQQGITELQQLMQTHFQGHDELLKILTDLMDRETALLGSPTQSTTETRRLAERQQADLQLLGFRIADDIDTALGEFRSLYLPDNGVTEMAAVEVDALLEQYADQARSDAEKYQVKAEVVAAIRLASLRTGVEFPFLMELAATESSFNPAARASTSDAVGLYQFREGTWLEAVRSYGSRYGLHRFRDRIDFVVDQRGVMQPTISDPELQETVLDLRLQPRLSALLAAESVRSNMRQLTSTLDRKPGRTDLYLSHFFGTSGAISFLQALAEDPGKVARDLFPGPAKRNRTIFQDRSKKPRTVAEIYRLFARKFNTSRFGKGDTG